MFLAPPPPDRPCCGFAARDLMRFRAGVSRLIQSCRSEKLEKAWLALIEDELDDFGLTEP